MKKIFIFFIMFVSLLTLSYAKPTLTIYTYDSFAASWGPAPKIKKVFEQKYNCNLKFIATSSAIGAFRKIQIEGKDTKADILLGLDTSSYQLAKDSGLFVKHNIDTSNIDALPVKWSDDEFVPYDYSFFAFVYDSNRLKNPPHSFEELASMPKDFKVVIEDPRSSTPGLGLLLWVKEIYKNKAEDYWKRLAPHILTITKGWSEAYGLFLKKEADMVLSYTTSPSYHIIAENKFNYKYAHFKEGHYAQIEVAGILKSSKNKKLAREFLKFTLSQEFAKVIPTTNWTYPVVKTELPKGFEPPLSKMLLLDGKVVDKNRKSYINEWLKAVSK